MFHYETKSDQTDKLTANWSGIFEHESKKFHCHWRKCFFIDLNHPSTFHDVVV